MEKTNKVPTWLLVLVFISLALFSGWALRRNSTKMIELREIVLEADQAGEGVNVALNELGNFINGHMNTEMRAPLQLVETYNRDFKKSLNNSNVSDSIAKAAEQKCTGASIPSTTQAECIQREIIEAVGENQAPLDATLAPELYTFDYVSPKWSTDLAGFSVLATVFTGLILIIQSATQFIVGRHFSFLR